VKNIVICLDGTGNEVKGRANTNVVEFYDLLDLRDPAKQVAYYDPGVGTFSAPGAWTPFARFVTRTAGLAFGYGMRQNLAEAYTYLMRTYEPGDRVYLFGFSRGAYTARALSGLVYTVRIFRPGAENLVQYAVSSYCRKETDWDQLQRFRWVFAQRDGNETRVPIDYLGLWDTVKASGILRWDEKWPYTRQLVNVRKVRHAVSIDEYRRPYAYYGATPHHDADPPPDVYEVWFAGVHSDVGGTFPDDGPLLSTIPLKWMAQGAHAAGVLMKPGPYHALCGRVTAANALGAVHRMGRAWRLAGYRRRTIPKGARVHDSVRARLADGTLGYRVTLPEGYVWKDEGWASG
jgi:uncharacterized protein (DUF2235 family)